MKVYETSNIRNIALLGHGGSGKTLLAESLAYKSGIIERLGKIEDGSTLSDYEQEERQRSISISTSLIPIEHKGVKINILDVPGYFDFVGEQYSALQVADAVIIAVDALAGVEVGTEKAYEEATERGLPVAFVVTKAERENVNFKEVFSKIKAITGPKIVPFQIPINPGIGFNAVADIFNNKAYTYENGKVSEGSVPEEQNVFSTKYKDIIYEIAASTDESLMEKYFDGVDLTNEELMTGVKTAIINEELIPIYCVSAVNNVALDKFLDSIVDNFPNPLEAQGSHFYDASKPFSAFVFKTLADPYVGKLSLFKVMTGSLDKTSELYNTNKDKKEKPSHVYTLIGKKQVEVEKMVAGDIGAFAKLAFTTTNDTLCDPKEKVKYEEIKFPQAIIFTGIEAVSKADEDKLGTGLNKLKEEDPTIVIERNAETHQTVLYGMGETHLDVISSKLKNKFSTAVNLTLPIIPYRETIKKSATAKGRHKKQSGGRGQFGVVDITFEPTYDLGMDIEFVDSVVGGSVPRNFIPAVEKGLKDCIKEGVLAGYPVVGLRATLFDGSYHPVDSDEMSFKMASSLAYREGMANAAPVLLEPIYKVQITVPEEYMGDVMGDINKKRGKIMGMEQVKGGKQQINALVPLGEMFKYATELRSMTQAKGFFTMSFEQYEEVPNAFSDKIVAEAKERKKQHNS